MKIGIDYISALSSGGNATYTKGLIKGLSLIDKDNIYYLYSYLHKKLFHKDQLIEQDNFRYRFAILPYLTDSEYFLPILKSIRKVVFSLSYRLNNLDLFHITNPANYYPSLDNFVITIHDLAPFYREDFVKKNIVLFYKEHFKEIIGKAKTIIAVSNFTKGDILKRFNLPEDKIRVIYEGADNIFRPIQSPKVLKQYGLNKKYILSVGQLQPRKNLPILLKAYSLLPKRLKDIYDLVLVGQSRDQASLNKLKKIITEEKIENKVKILGYVDINDLPILYSQAYIFVYLSLLEGFGLPVLESLKCGRPALIADNSSLPEVAGPAGFLTNPRDIEEITSKLEELLRKPDLIEDLTKFIPEQVKKFSWQKTAQQTLKVYREAV